jgi:hypothetical protein
MVSDEHLGADGQTWLMDEFFMRAAPNGPTNGFFNFCPNNLAQSRFLFYDKDMVGRLSHKALPNALLECLEREAHVPGSLDAVIDEVIEGVRCV